LPKTNDICQESGIYKVTDHEHPKEEPMTKGDRFPPCSACRKETHYQLIRRTSS